MSPPSEYVDVTEPDNTVLRFKFTRHFLEQLKARTERELHAIDWQALLANAYYIPKRPRNIRLLLKHDLREAVYLWYKPQNLLLVLARTNDNNGSFNLFTTAYVASDSDWVQEWGNKTPIAERRKFGTVRAKLHKGYHVE